MTRFVVTGDVLPIVARIVTDPARSTPTVNEADVWPSGMVSDTGTLASCVSELSRRMVEPPGGAGLLRVTVALALFGRVTGLGLNTSEAIPETSPGMAVLGN